MDLHDILSPLILVFGVISLKEIVLDFMEGWRSAPPSEMRVTGHPDDLEQGPTFDSSETDGETIDAFLYIGEPWFTSTNL